MNGMRLCRYKARRGALLIIALSILFVLMVLAMALISQGGAALHTALRARSENLAEQAIEVTKIRFVRTVQPRPSASPTPSPDPEVLPLEGEFDVSPEYASGDPKIRFTVTGKWSEAESVYRRLPDDPDISKKPADYIDYDKSLVPLVGYSQDLSDYFKDATKDFIKKGFTNIPVPPWHSLLTIHTPLGRSYLAMYSPAFPFGAFAPEGEVKIERLSASANPTIKQVLGDIRHQNKDYNERDLYTGVPVLVYGQNRVEIDQFHHGTAYSQNGPILMKVASPDEDDGDILCGAPGYRQSISADYADEYVRQAREAKSRISATALDKTDFILGSPLDVSSYVNGGGGGGAFQGILSLQQASHFPFLTYPLFKVSQYFLVTEVKFSFHLPFPPDGSKPLSPKQENEKNADVEVIKAVNTAWYDGSDKDHPKLYNLDSLSDGQKKDLYYQNQNVRGKLTASKPYAHNSAKQGDIQDLVDLIDSTYSGYDPDKDIDDDKNPYPKPGPLKSLRSRQIDYATARHKEWDGSGSLNPGKEKDYPPTLKSEKEFLDRGDQKGHNYGKLMKNVLNMLLDLFKGHWKDLVADIFNPIRVVHYKGGAPNITFIPDKTHPDGFSWECDLTVPRGRSLKLDCNATIKGDVWIQEGACLYVTGNLSVVDPTFGDSMQNSPESKSFGSDNPLGLENPLAPTGRVFLERGATLIVDGNFSCQGTKWLGSVVVDSELGGVQYITSAILVKGNVDIPHGIFPGLSLVNISKALNISAITKFVNILIDATPIIAKVAGPFHYRLCCFAAYADTFRLEIFDLAPIPVFFPTWEHDNNINTTIFEYVSIIYSTIQNAFMGEYLFTDSDWWIIGEGVVPMVPKVGMIGNVVDMLKYLNPRELGFKLEEVINSLKDEILKGLQPGKLMEYAEHLLVDILKTILVKAVENIFPFGGGEIDKMIEKILGDRPTSDLLDRLRHEYTVFIDQGITGVMKDLANEAVSNLEDYLEKNIYFKFYEVPGVLVYSGQKIRIGSADADPNDTMAASGLFIAVDDVEIYATQTVGCAISQKGNVTVKNLMYYPYFTRASLRVPKTKDLFSNLFDFEPPGSGGKPVDIGVTFYRAIGEGWNR